MPQNNTKEITENERKVTTCPFVSHCMQISDNYYNKKENLQAGPKNLKAGLKTQKCEVCYEHNYITEMFKTSPLEI